MTKLTEFEKFVIEQKGTERPYSGEYYTHDQKGAYHCKKCMAPLYRSEHKFQAHCGWPAFDDEIEGAVLRLLDADGKRIEIVCNQCGGHLGHLFEGEKLTDKNIRHCVNSVSMAFVADNLTKDDKKLETELATFGGGCFWCLESFFLTVQGVMGVTSGYAGGNPNEADYKSVCKGQSGHAEVIQIEFDPKLISFHELLEMFFVSHDPTTLNRQGNDIGTQYRSVIFAHDAEQQGIAIKVIAQINQEKLWDKPLVTELVALNEFYPAEQYHQNYYQLNADSNRYCQLVINPKLAKFKQRFANKLK